MNCTFIRRKANIHPVTFIAILKKSFNYYWEPYIKRTIPRKGTKQKTNPLNCLEFLSMQRVPLTELLMHDNQFHLFWGQQIPLTTTINVAPLTNKNLVECLTSLVLSRTHQLTRNKLMRSFSICLSIDVHRYFLDIDGRTDQLCMQDIFACIKNVL